MLIGNKLAGKFANANYATDCYFIRSCKPSVHPLLGDPIARDWAEGG